MSAHEIAICNGGLINIGASPIMSFDDGTKSAQLCKTRFAHCRDAVLRMHPWNCATKRVIISPDTTSPAFGYSNRFPLPSDCLRVLDAGDDVEYRLEGGYILCDESEIELKYVYREEDASRFDTLLAETIGAYLVSTIAYALSQSDTVTQQALSNFDKALKRAKTADAQEDDVPPMETNTWIDSRVTESPGRSNR